MAPPLSARRRFDAQATATPQRIQLQMQLSGDERVTDLQGVAMTPRTEASVVSGITPRPVMRGPQTNSNKTATLAPEEENRIEAAFRLHDTAKTGEVDLSVFYGMCKTLELCLSEDVAAEWLAGRNESTGLTLEDFRALYTRILAAQTPGVRQALGHGPLTLREVVGTEKNVRSAFERATNGGTHLLADRTGTVLYALGLPDYYGDGFDRFVTEWLAIENKSPQSEINFHEFVSCANLVIDFAERKGGAA